MIDLVDRFRGCLLGLAVGDAVGTTVEFRPRGSFEPVVDMTGGGPFRLEPGEWTDDTSMALCLAASLLRCKGFDAEDQMNRYYNWREHGYMSSNGRCFDIGHTVSSALDRYTAYGNPFSGSTGAQSAGNGSIMRLAPIVLYFYPDRSVVAKYARESSRTTHGTAECLDACELMAEMILRGLTGVEKDGVLQRLPCKSTSERIISIADGEWKTKPRDQIKGSGYVVECLEAALWCFARTDTFRDAVLMATNLGDDADTTAAVCGQIGGAHYGLSGIPAAWADRVVMRDQIVSFADELRQSA